MRKRKGAVALAAVLAVSATVAACGDDKKSSDSSGVKACEVTDVGGKDDKGFNQTAWEGVTKAEKELDVSGKLLESKSDADYAPNINSFIKEKCSVIITVGFLLGPATSAAAKANPTQQFAIIDSDANDDVNNTPDDPTDDKNLENVRALNFSTDQPSFVAGYLAAGMTKSGTVATYGGINIPPVSIFMDGFVKGVNYYNKTKGKSVKALGWDPAKKEGSFTNNFEKLDDGKKMAQNFADEGADIIFPVAGPVGLGSSAFAKEKGNIRIIGVDVDQYESNSKEKEVYLTSVVKRIDSAVFDTVSNIKKDGKPGADYVGTFANGGVGIAPYHDQDKDVPDELKKEVEQLIKDFTDGKLTVDA